MSAALVRVLDTAAGRLVVEATAHGIARIDRVGSDVVAVGDGRGDDDDNAGRPATDTEASSDVDADAAADAPSGGTGSGRAADHLARLAEHLDDYLAGTRRSIDVPLDFDAAGIHDEFAREVYREIGHIPYGETSTYGEISVDAGRPRNARRVGRLCSLVPAQFLIPVHRVIRADGGLGACPEHRLQLLEHERRNVQAGRPVAFPRGFSG